MISPLHQRSLTAASRSLLGLITCVSICSCAPEDQLGDPLQLNGSSATDQAARRLKADEWRAIAPELEDEEVSVARLSLSALRDATTQLSDAYAVFEDHFSPAETIFKAEVERELREGLKGTLGAQRLFRRGERGVLRQDIFQARAALDPLKLTEASAIPFKIDAGAQVTVSRLFDDEDAARTAPPITPLDLPFSRARALALPEGTVVQVPVHAQLSVNVSGQSLSRSWGRVDEFTRLLKSSASGFTSASVQGVLVARGLFTLTLTRHQSDQVRVRVQRAHQVNASARAQLSAGVSQRLTLLPSATIERVKGLKDRLLRWGRAPSQRLIKLRDRVATLRRALPDRLKPLLDHPQVDRSPEWLRSALSLAEERVDPALTYLERALSQGQGDLESAEAWLSERVESTLGRVSAAADPALARLKRYSERAFNLQLSAELSAESATRFGLMGDYLLDLSTESGRLAFDALLSGAARWEGLSALNRSGEEAFNLIDLTLADGLSLEGDDGVRCLQRAELKSRVNTARINAQTPITAWRAERGQEVHELRIETERALELWRAELWRVDQGLTLGRDTRREVFQSGQVALVTQENTRAHDPESDHGDEYTQTSLEEASRSDGIYWFSWARQWPAQAQTPVAEAFGEALNLGGPVSVAHGVSERFFTEAPGALSSQLTLIFPPTLLSAIFEDAPLDLFWRAAARVAEGFDNRFGLPYIGGFSPSGISREGEIACDVIARHWGRGYCGLIQDEVIEALQALRDSSLSGASLSDAERRRAQRDWLAGLYERQLLLNPIGSRVIARLFCELAALLDRADEVRLRLKLRHPSSPELSVSGVIESETIERDSAHLNHALEVAEWLGVGEGLAY